MAIELHEIAPRISTVAKTAVKSKLVVNCLKWFVVFVVLGIYAPICVISTSIYSNVNNH